MSAPFLIEAQGCGGKRMFAAIDSSVHHVAAQVAESRLSAWLHPFATAEAARDALVAAGGTTVREAGR